MCSSDLTRRTPPSKPQKTDWTWTLWNLANSRKSVTPSSLALRRTLATFLLLTLTGCALSGDPDPPVAVRPALPPVPPELKKDCPLPPIPEIKGTEQAVAVIADHRLAYVCQRGKTHRAVGLYEDVRKRFGG